MTEPSPTTSTDIRRFRRSNFHDEERKGFGGEATVYSGYNDTYGYVAFKEFHRYCGQIDMKEANLLLKMQARHPNVVQVYGLLTNDDNVCIGYVMELMTHGNLHDAPLLIMTTSKCILGCSKQAEDCYIYMKKEYCTEIMLLGGSIQILKLSDFGISRVMNGGDPTPCKGTYTYMAPEVYIKVNGTCKYGQPADIWSLTISIWEMFYRKDPYGHRNVVGYGRMCFVMEGGRPILDGSIDEKVALLLSRGWDQNADKRPLIVEFIELAKQLENQVNHSVRRIPPPKPKKPIMAVSPTEAKMPTVLSKELEKCCDSALETSTTTMDDDKTIVNLSDVVESHTIVRNLPPVNIHLPSVSQIEVFVESVVFAKEETNHTVLNLQPKTISTISVQKNIEEIPAANIIDEVIPEHLDVLQGNDKEIPVLPMENDEDMYSISGPKSLHQMTFSEKQQYFKQKQHTASPNTNAIKQQKFLHSPFDSPESPAPITKDEQNPEPMIRKTVMISEDTSELSSLEDKRLSNKQILLEDTGKNFDVKISEEYNNETVLEKEKKDLNLLLTPSTSGELDSPPSPYIYENASFKEKREFFLRQQKLLVPQPVGIRKSRENLHLATDPKLTNPCISPIRQKTDANRVNLANGDLGLAQVTVDNVVAETQKPIEEAKVREKITHFLNEQIKVNGGFISPEKPKIFPIPKKIDQNQA